MPYRTLAGGKKTNAQEGACLRNACRKEEETWPSSPLARKKRGKGGRKEGKKEQ